MPVSIQHLELMNRWKYPQLSKQRNNDKSATVQSERACFLFLQSGLFVINKATTKLVSEVGLEATPFINQTVIKLLYLLHCKMPPNITMGQFLKTKIYLMKLSDLLHFIAWNIK